MARSFRQSRYRREDDLGEDVNPSAYIVNLADCMLVLACGFMVAMIAFWNIDISSVEELDQESLEAVDPEPMVDSLVGEGSSYVEAGTVYVDPATGEMWLLKNNADAEGSESTTGDGADARASGAGGSGTATGADADGFGGTGSAPSDEDILRSRAMGAD